MTDAVTANTQLKNLNASSESLAVTLEAVNEKIIANKEIIYSSIIESLYSYCYKAIGCDTYAKAKTDHGSYMEEFAIPFNTDWTTVRSKDFPFNTIVNTLCCEILGNETVLALVGLEQSTSVSILEDVLAKLYEPKDYAIVERKSSYVLLESEEIVKQIFTILHDVIETFKD